MGYIKLKTKKQKSNIKVKVPGLSVKIGKIKMANPVMVASGTFGYGKEYKSLIDQSGLGAIVAKSITIKPSPGNPPPRICETPAGMLNAIGIQNNGLENFIKEKMPYLRKIKVPLLVSIAGNTIREYQRLAERLNRIKGIAGLELNVSCPNVSQGVKSGMMFAQDPGLIYDLVRAVKKVTGLTIISKLSADVADITSVAKAARDAGTDAISLTNSLSAMAVDINTRRPKLANVTGGLTGPAIKPIALRAVWEVAQDVKIPLIGIGGIIDWQDALEFIICGATAVAVGTGNFVNPRVTGEIIDGLAKYLKKEKIKTINDLIGTLEYE